VQLQRVGCELIKKEKKRKKKREKRKREKYVLYSKISFVNLQSVTFGVTALRNMVQLQRSN